MPQRSIREKASPPAEPGDPVSVSIKDMVVAKQTISVTIPRVEGLPDKMEAPP